MENESRDGKSGLPNHGKRIVSGYCAKEVLQADTGLGKGFDETLDRKGHQWLPE